MSTLLDEMPGSVAIRHDVYFPKEQFDAWNIDLPTIYAIA